MPICTAYPSTFHSAVLALRGRRVTCTDPRSSDTDKTTFSSIPLAATDFFLSAMIFLANAKRAWVGEMGKSGDSTHCLNRSNGSWV